MRYLRLLALATALGACSDDQDETSPPLDAGSQDISITDDSSMPAPDAALGLSLNIVPGEITYAARVEGGTYLYSIDADGGNRIRLTAEADNWSFHAVSPNRRYIAAVKTDEAIDNHAAQLSQRGRIWIINIRTGDKYPLTPDNCDAGIGGVAWTGDSFIAFAMSCDGETSKGFLASYSDQSQNVGNMFPFAEHMFPVRDVSAALFTSRATYVVDQERCEGQRCVAKPQIWVADTETLQACQVTEGNRSFLGGENASLARVGDYNPSFTEQLQGIVFSRNVADKGSSSTGHHDIMRIGLDLNALDRNDIRCQQPGTESNLSETLYNDSLGNGSANELYPQAPIGVMASGRHALLTIERPNDESDSHLVTIDLTGAKNQISVDGEFVHFASWITSDTDLTGSR